MKIVNPSLYTFGVIILTLHIVDWIAVIANGFTAFSVLALITSFIFGTYDILHSIEHDTSRKDDDK